MKNFVIATALFSVSVLTTLSTASADTCTDKRRKEHCQWSLTNNGHANWWYEINNSATLDADSTTSDYYYQRAAAHCEWFLKNIAKQPAMWEQINYSAYIDCDN